MRLALAFLVGSVVYGQIKTTYTVKEGTICHSPSIMACVIPFDGAHA
jgi:hypothetical protein